LWLPATYLLIRPNRTVVAEEGKPAVDRSDESGAAEPPVSAESLRGHAS
jgi:hypothetical protein